MPQRTQRINRVEISFSNYLETKDLVDEYGNLTGEKEIVYSLPLTVKENFSLSDGQISRQMFGDSLDFNATLILSNDKNEEYNINEKSVFWHNENTLEQHNYIVVGMIKSLNLTNFALKKVR